MSVKIIHRTTFEVAQLSDTPICNPPSSDNIKGLKKLRNETPFRIIIGYININSVRYKLESLFDLASANFSVLMISETKIYETFPE